MQKPALPLNIRQGVRPARAGKMLPDDVCVNLRGFDVAVAEQLLHCANVSALL